MAGATVYPLLSFEMLKKKERGKSENVIATGGRSLGGALLTVLMMCKL